MVATSPIPVKWILLTLCGFTAVLLLGIVTPRITGDKPGYDAQRAATRYVTLAKIRADEDKLLTHAAWVDENKQIVRLPLEEVLPKALDELRAKPVAMGDLLPGVSPPTANLAPAPNAAPATNNARKSNPTPAPKKP